MTVDMVFGSVSWSQAAKHSMTKITRLLSLMSCLSVAILLAGCANNQMVSASPDILRIAVAPNSPPMIYKSGGEYLGLEADFGRALAAEMGKTPRFIERSWDRLLPSLQTGEVDIVMSNMTVTNERRSYADFTTPYLEVGQMILVRANEFQFYSDPRIIALVEKKIGVEVGTVSEAYVQRTCLKATVVPLKSPDQAIHALASGKIDAFLHDAPVIWSLSSAGAAQGVTMVPTPLGDDELAWAVRRGDSVTLNKANATIAKWKKNGQLSQMVKRWLPIGQ
ncbi:substrate-binding periplasmic protein [Haloferula chungangensis]|uniref:Substrate-binding periplasmic protein n=1 Tax=Haloferula chungangensis TaxID=1048331 RepID=A0ABW2LEB1_9BACT